MRFVLNFSTDLIRRASSSSERAMRIHQQLRDMVPSLRGIDKKSPLIIVYTMAIKLNIKPKIEPYNINLFIEHHARKEAPKHITTQIYPDSVAVMRGTVLFSYTIFSFVAKFLHPK